MSDDTHNRLRQRLQRAEDVLDALRGDELDAIVRKGGVALLRLRDVEEALRRKQEDLNRAQSIAQLGSWRWAAREDTLIWSEESPRLFGLPADTSLTYGTFLSVVHPEDRDRVDEQWSALRRGDPFDIEHRVVAAGALKWMRARAEAERDSAGNVIGGMGTVQDITRQKHNEETLHAKERQLRAAMEAGRVFSFEWYPASDALYRSDNCAGILGQTREAAVQTTGAEHLRRVDPADRDALADRMRGLTPQAPQYETAYRYVREDGQIIWLEESGQADFDTQGAVAQIRGIAADATARIEAQQREARDVAAATAAQAAVDTVNAMGEGVALLDPRGRIRNVNPAFAALTEHDGAALVGQDIRRLLPNMFDQPHEDIQATIARFTLKPSAADGGDALSVTLAGGARRWVVPTLSAVHGEHETLVGFVLTLRDITALIEAQKRLAESERKYRELVENANSVIIRITPDHRITFFNEYAQLFFGYTAEDVTGKHVVGTIVPEIDSEGRDLKRMTAAITAQPEQYSNNENENMCKDGRRVWMQWSNRAIRDPYGQVREILCVGTDMTERKQMQAQADQYRLRLRALSDRLILTEEQERRRVATQIHDTVIQTLSLSNMRLGAVIDDLDDPSLAGRRESVLHIRKLIGKGIAECRGLMGELSPPLLYEFGLVAALEDFAEKQRDYYDASVTVDSDDQVKPLNEARRGLLFQCARELVANAIKYAGPCEIVISLTRHEDMIHLEVADTGRGFDPADVERFTVDDDGGFGLFNIRERLAGSGGRLDLVSAPGKGTRATIRVPVEERGAQG